MIMENKMETTMQGLGFKANGVKIWGLMLILWI